MKGMKINKKRSVKAKEACESKPLFVYCFFSDAGDSDVSDSDAGDIDILILLQQKHKFRTKQSTNQAVN
jgi:hypothetical protein